MTTGFFQVGARYRNRKTAFEVSGIDADALTVRLEDVTETTYSAEMQVRIISNMEREQARFLPGGLAANRENDFAWTLGAVAATARLEAEVPPRAWPGFVRTYENYTGVVLSPESRGVYLLAGDDNKRGAELRLYFSEELASSSRLALPAYVFVVAGSSPGDSRVNNNAFWWHLVERCGFVAGPIQDDQAIRMRISPELQPDFEQGIAEWGG
jgi:hypothetical protein